MASKTQNCAEMDFVKKLNAERMELSFIRHFSNGLPTCSHCQHLSGGSLLRYLERTEGLAEAQNHLTT